MKDRRATISSVDHMIYKTSLLPARGLFGMAGIYHTAACDRNGGKVACPLYSLPLFPSTPANVKLCESPQQSWEFTYD